MKCKYSCRRRPPPSLHNLDQQARSQRHLQPSILHQPASARIITFLYVFTQWNSGGPPLLGFLISILLFIFCLFSIVPLWLARWIWCGEFATFMTRRKYFFRTQIVYHQSVWFFTIFFPGRTLLWITPKLRYIVSVVWVIVYISCLGKSSRGN